MTELSLRDKGGSSPTTGRIDRPKQFDPATLLKHDDLREARRIREEAAEAQLQVEAKTKEEKIDQVKAILEQFQEALPFLKENTEQAFPMPDGSRVLMVKRSDRLFILHTTDPDRDAPRNHYYKQNVPLITSPDVVSWQIVVFPHNTGTVSGLYHYPRPALDYIRDVKKIDDWAASDVGFMLSTLEKKPLAEVETTLAKLTEVAVLPEGLVKLIKEFQERKADLIQKVEQVRAIKQKYGEDKPIKIVGKEQWLCFKQNSIYIFNTPEGGKHFYSHQYPINDIELNIMANPENTMGPGFVTSTDVTRMKIDIAEHKFSANDADYHHDRYDQTAILKAGKLSTEAYQITSDALQIILDLDLESPAEKTATV